MSSMTLDLSRRTATASTDRIVWLDSLGTQRRLAAYRAGSFDRADLFAWAARYPDEPPIVNGELEWIASTLADLD